MDVMAFTYHYDLKSGDIFVPRKVKCYIDGTRYDRPNAGGCDSMKVGGTILYKVVNTTRARKLLKVLTSLQTLDAVAL